MKRIVALSTAALLALLILTPAAVAQEEDMMDQSIMQEQPKMDQSMMMEKGKMMEMPKTGGPAIGSLLLPAAALLVGTGVMGAYLIRRRG